MASKKKESLPMMDLGGDETHLADSLLIRTRDVLRTLSAELMPLHSWEFVRKRAGIPEPMLVTDLLRDLEDALGN